MIMTNEEFTRTLTKEQREYLQERYEKQLEEAIDSFQIYQERKCVGELVEYRKKMYVAQWFKSLAECEESDLQEQADKYWITAHIAILKLDKE